MSKSEDLELQQDEAEQVVGGAGKKHVTQKSHKTAKIVGGGIESTKTPGTPSPLSPEPVETYMEVD
jgi:hypothetical protein